MKNKEIRKLTISALFIALASVASTIRLYHFPFGGSVTLFSMLIITLPAWIYGVKIGALCGLIYGMIQFVFDPAMISILQVMLDYVLAFSVVGIAGFVRNKKHSLLKGYIIAVLGRWIVATFAGLAWFAVGYTAWNGFSPLPYSMIYNGAYIFTEGILTIIVILMPPVRKALDHIKKLSL